MEIRIEGDRGQVSTSKVEQSEDGYDIELGFIYDGEEYFMQVKIADLERALEILKNG